MEEDPRAGFDGTGGGCTEIVGQVTRLYRKDEPYVIWPEIKNGVIVKNSIPNVRAFLAFLRLELWHDQFENRIRIGGSEEYQVLNDHVQSLLWGQANELRFRPSITFLRHAFAAIAADMPGIPCGIG